MDDPAKLSPRGVLHLPDWDREDNAEAEFMEQLDYDVLAKPGIADPYVEQ